MQVTRRTDVNGDMVVEFWEDNKLQGSLKYLGRWVDASDSDFIRVWMADLLYESI